MKHGTGGYTRGCRCEVCRDATAAYRRRKRAENAPVKTPRPEPEPLATVKRHGTASGYTQGCRAACCRNAQAAARRALRARNAARAAAATVPGAPYVADLPARARRPAEASGGQP